ncbi:hypothetical protein LTR35_017047 [Friedmanniomyces endolithicus]|uniref:Uncharacterized protein n=1 Tax=Friedmanniomyces endolithicus TaxID=329885 RepID=A0AAN6J4Z4_9PEZI|nr:hypothetical protein LTS09_011878 [Friedmanniomyces endolithicus]KAK0265927.1 hypothetical protein LTR35_017047 [Friedmanniomyces endolithicus]KAK0271060.1 hypothetical protein LTS00_016715 [Friedmanniomyces endolithicus]KAK0305240.1 hypothetical protein LTR82_016859 [Friedmanniomyces endolithicus]KAK0976301.1 hypothetical protein LTR54_016541 [Friedmanniomyces endolithicus]
MFDTLRSLGLESVAHLWPYGRLAKKREDPKAVIEKSRGLALSRCAIHILPICVSIVIISISTIHIYLGPKLQELLIVGSTTAVVMHVLRHELISGDGVPFGLLGGGFQFSGLGYFWAPEFWGAILHAPLTFRKKATLAGTLLVAGLIAVAAGPSCAILLVPREQTWNAGGGTFYLPGTNDTLWSTDFTSMMAPFDEFCFWPNASSYATCPSGGYADLWSTFGEAGLARNPPRELDLTTARLYGSDTRIAMKTAMTDWTRLTNFAQIEVATRGIACQTTAVGIHGPTTVMLARLMNDWFDAVLQIPYSPSWPSKSEYKYWDTRTIKVASRVPVVRVACSDAQNLSSVSSNVQFPILPAYACPTGTQGVQLLEVNQAPTSHVRTTWVRPVPLGADNNATSAALLLEAPWDQQSNSRAVLGCSIDTRWAEADANFDDSDAWSTTNDQCSNYWTHFCPSKGSSWSPITLSSQWLQLLTPFTVSVDPGEPNMTTLEDILTNAGIGKGLGLDATRTDTELWNYANITSGLNMTISVERMLALLVADGLSRYGTSLVYGLDDSGVIEPNWPNRGGWNQTKSYAKNLINGRGQLLFPPTGDFVTQEAKVEITGYVFMATAFTDYLAIAILCLHLAIALAHTLVLMVRGTSSGCWDTISELFTLLVNSPPAPIALRNTCAGIRSLKTYSKITTIRAMAPESDGAIAHVVLCFDEDERATTFRMSELPGRPRSPYQFESESPEPAASFRSRGFEPSLHSVDDQVSILRSIRDDASVAFATKKLVIQVGRKYGDVGRRRSTGG